MAESTITLRLIAQDLASGNISKAIASIDKLAARGGIAGSIFQGIGMQFGMMLNPVQLVSKAVGAITDVMGGAIEAASNMEESQAKVNQVFTDSADVINDWASDSAQSFGLSEAAALEAAGTFGNFIQALGNTEAEANEMSRTIVELAADLASFNNQDINEVILALRSGLAGEAEPMRRLGVSISATRVEANILAKGIARTKGEITDAMKVAERYAIIMQDTTKAQGDFDRTSDGLANTQRRLAGEMTNAMAALGEALLPVATNFASFAANTIPDIVDAVGSLGEAFNDLHRALEPEFAAMDDMMAVSDKVAEQWGIEPGVLREAIQARYDAAKAAKALAEQSDVLAVSESGLTKLQQDGLAAQIALVKGYVSQGQTTDWISKELAYQLRLTEEQVDAAIAQERNIDKLVTTLFLESQGLSAVTEETEALATAEAEANAVARLHLTYMNQMAFSVPTYTEALDTASTSVDVLSGTLYQARKAQVELNREMEETAERRAAKLAEALATPLESFRDITDAAKETGRAIRKALGQDADKTLKALRAEERRLHQQRIKAMREENWRALDLIDARQTEVDEAIKAQQSTKRHYLSTIEAQRQQERQIDRIAERFDVSGKKVKRILEREGGDIDAVKAKLKVLGDTEATPTIFVDTSQASAAVAALARQLAALEQNSPGGTMLGIGATVHRTTKKGKKKDGAAGATYFPGDYGLVGEYAMERISNQGGVTTVTPIPGAGRGGITINIQGGTYLGTPEDARRWAAWVVPAIERERRRAGVA